MGLGNSANSELLSSHKQFPSSKKHLTLFSIPHALSSKSDSIYRADPKRHQPSIRAAVKQTRREAADAISRGEGGTSVGCLERHHFLSVGTIPQLLLHALGKQQLSIQALIFVSSLPEGSPKPKPRCYCTY